MADATENSEIVMRAYDGMAGGDAAAFLGALDPDVELHEPGHLPYGGTHRGHDEVIGFMKQAAGVVAPGELSVEYVIAEDDRVAALLRLGLKDGGEMLVSEHWVMRDGKAVELRTFWFDTAPGS